MRKSLLLTLLLALTSLSIHAQEFRAGYIVTLENDSIFGEINERAVQKNYESCLFKANKKTTEYTPNQIKAYGVIKGFHYKSGIKPDYFVEILVEGKLSLYKFQESYITDKDTLIELSVRWPESVNKDGRTYQKIDTRWKGVLRYLISDCQDYNSKGENLRFNEKEITNAVVNYNVCTSSEYKAYKADLPWSKVRMGISLGVARTTINSKRTGTDIHSRVAPASVSSNDITLGFSYMLSAPRVSKNFEIGTNPILLASNFYSYKSEDGKNTETSLKATSLVVPVVVRLYVDISPTSKMFIEVGPQISFTLSQSSAYLFERIEPSSVQRDTGEYLKMKGAYTGLAFDAGYQKAFKKFTLSSAFNWSRSSHVMDTNQVETTQNQYSISISYSK